MASLAPRLLPRHAASLKCRPLHTGCGRCSAATPATPVVFRRLEESAAEGRTALRDAHGEYSYAGLWRASRLLADRLSGALEGRRQQRVAFLCPNDAAYVMTAWACWISGQIGVLKRVQQKLIARTGFMKKGYLFWELYSPA